MEETEFEKVVGQLNVPVWAFRPDNWTLAFLRGLMKIAPKWRGKKVWEVGVGTGVNIICLNKIVDGVRWYISDYDERAVPLAMENFSRIGTDGEFCPLVGVWDLVSSPNGELIPQVQAIFACIPQVPSKQGLSSVEDALAHYYDPRHYPGAWNELGLGLCRALLVRARDVLCPEGQVVLNLGGRPGLQRLSSLFFDAGYHPEVLWAETICQHPGTSLESLATLETNGHKPFEFFRDKNAEAPISAREAERLRLAGVEVFHRIYVIVGTR